MTRSEKAKKYFTDGYNCSQSVVLAFSDLFGIPSEKLASFAAPLGGGVGRLREVCGAVSGMMLVLGAVEGKYPPEDREAKAALYRDEQYLASLFAKENGSIICRELLEGTKATAGGEPEERTAEFYKKRPCLLLVGFAAETVEKFLIEKGFITEEEK